MKKQQITSREDLMKMPAAQRLVVAYKETREVPKYPTDETLRCSCTCHLGSSIICPPFCIGCKKSRQFLYTPHPDALDDLDVCCLAIAPSRLQSHQTAISHRVLRYSVLLADVRSLTTLNHSLPLLAEHEELWIPLMKLIYSHGILHGINVTDRRKEMLARTLLVHQFGAGCRFAKRLYEHHVAKHERATAQRIRDHYGLSPMGNLVGLDGLSAYYQIAGDSTWKAYWGEDS